MAEVLASLKQKGGGQKYTETSLWTNGSPSNDFNAQTITISDSISNYKYIAIDYCYNKSNTGVTSRVIYDVTDFKKAVKDGSTNHTISGLTIEGANNVNYARPVFYISDTSIAFGLSSTLNGSGAYAAGAIPLEILGINELAHGKQHDNAIKISHIYARLWSASNTALGGALVTLDGRDTVTIGSRDSGFASCYCDFYDVTDTRLEQNTIPVGGATYTVPANAYSVYIWGTVTTARQASISDIEIYKGE